MMVNRCGLPWTPSRKRLWSIVIPHLAALRLKDDVKMHEIVAFKVGKILGKKSVKT